MAGAKKENFREMDLFPADKRRLQAAFLVLSITFLVYLPALQNGFVNWDDTLYIYENLNIRSIGLDFIWWSFSDASVGHWHPLTWVSIALDYAVWGLNPLGFHLTNIILHSLNTFLVFVLTVRLIGGSGPAIWRPAGSPLPTTNYEFRTLVAASTTAILFGIHPIHVESVAWAAERKDVLSLFFFLTTLLSYIKYIESKKKSWYITALLFFTISLMSKPMVVTLPAILLVLDFYPFQRLKIDARSAFIEKAPFFLLSFISSILTIWATKTGGDMENSVAFITRLFISARGYIYYLIKMAVPVNLAPLYPYPAKVNILAVEYMGSAIIFISITLYCLWSLRKGGLFFSVWLYYVVTLLPVIGIIHVGQQDIADRYTYMPSIAPFILTGVATGYIYDRFSRRVLFITLVLFLFSGALIYRTIEQIRIWHDSMTLWTHEINLFPKSSIAHGNLGQAYMVSGNYQPALREINRAIALDVSYAEHYFNRGTLEYKAGNYLQAIRDFSMNLEINKRNPLALINRGRSYTTINEYGKAMQDFDAAMEIDPRRPETYYNKGLVYSRLGEIEKALKSYKQAADLGLKQAEDEILRSKVDH